MAKHVIFLGAGASRTSRYPLGEELRTDWLSSEDALLTRVLEYVPDEGQIPMTVVPEGSLGGALPHQVKGLLKEAVRSSFHDWFKPFAESLDLFRNGGFGTIDEFCFHVRDSRATDVPKLKSLLAFVLGMHDPEKHFAVSDYYSMLQRLFLPQSLAELRPDVAILSFNYDPFLEWLLDRALHVRLLTLGKTKAEIHKRQTASVTSGFGFGGVPAIEKGTGFCLLKLHGIILWPQKSACEAHDTEPPGCSYHDLFECAHGLDRFKLLSSVCRNYEAPIIFPWEILRGGQFIPQQEFCLADAILKNPRGVSYRRGRLALDADAYSIYRAIWTRARQEVQEATRISFVGLSMHSYLDEGLRFLLDGKRRGLEWSITDGYSSDFNHTMPSSPARRASLLLQSLGHGGDPTLWADFGQFIRHEL